MEHTKFSRWLKVCNSRGLTDEAVATLLHCGRASVTRWKSYDPPEYIGLAISALEAGLKPWSIKK